MNSFPDKKFGRIQTKALAVLSIIPLALTALTGCADTGGETAANTLTQSGSAQSQETTATGQTLIDQFMAENHAYWTADQDLQDSQSKIDIDLGSVTGSDTNTAVTADGATVTITKGGVYDVSGKLEGQLVVEAGDDEQVTLLFDGVNITNPLGPAVWIKSADGVRIQLASGSENSLADGGELNEDLDGAVFSQTDLEIDGDGQLTVTGNVADGIVSKDDLVILGGNITVSATDDAIRGKDALVILGGVLDLTAGGDGLKTTNTGEEDRGYFLIRGGVVSITAQGDGIDAASDALIDGGAVTIIESDEGVEAVNLIIGNGELTIKSTDDGLNATVGSEATASSNATEGSPPVEPDAVDFAGGDMGALDLPPGGMPDDGAGLGSMGGEPGGGGPNGPSGPGGPGGDADFARGDADFAGGMPGETPDGSQLVIYGGVVVIDAEGDGIDSNGTLEISGGEVTVFGTTRGGNGAFDSAGEFTITGGTIWGLSAGQMEQRPSQSEQNYLEADIRGGANVAVQVQSPTGEVLAEINAPKDFGYVFYSSPSLPEESTVSVS